MPATPLVNGTNYSWANVTLILFGVPVTGVTEISYSAKQKKENNYGAGVEPVSRGYGNKEYEGSISLYADVWKKIIAASPDRDPLQIAPFDISFARLHDMDPLFFRAGNDAANIAEMTGGDRALFERLHGDTLRALGYL